MADGLIGNKNPGFVEEPSVDRVFEKYPSASWSVQGKPAIIFPVTNITEDGGNRIVNRERPYRDGAKIDDVGSKPKKWTLQCYFENSIKEGSSAASPLYPTILNALLATFDTHETGDLVVPTIGKVRARAVSYKRDEKNDERDAAAVSLEFIQDNEDNIDATSFSLPSAKGSVRMIADVTTFSAQSDAVWSSSLADLNEFADGLEAIANYPGSTLQDIDTQAGIVVGATDRVLDAFTSKSNNPKTKARSMLSDPDSSITHRKLVALRDTASRARQEARDNEPAIIRYLVESPLSLFEISAQIGQDVTKLLKLNGDVDPFRIPAQTIIRIFDQ